MHTSITITRARIIRTLFAGLLTAAALLGLASAAEALSAPRAQLTVVNAATANRYDVRVTGYISMTQSEAQNRIAGGEQVKLRLWEQDGTGNPDDLVFGLTTASVSASSRGLEFAKTWSNVSGGTLNQDPGFCEELYAGVRLMNGTVTLTSSTSNIFYGCFSG
jgi:hypothetical protein